LLAALCYNHRMNCTVVRILLAEDNPGDAALLLQTLHQGHTPQYDVTHVASLAPALAHLVAESFDVLLLDLTLPDGTATEIVLRAHAAAPHVPIVILTHLSDAALDIAAIRHNIHGYVIKDRIDAPYLAYTIRYAIERKRADETLRENEERLAWILETTGLGLWFNQMPLGRLDWDKQTCALYFIPPDVAPTIALFWQRLHPDDREPTRLAIEAALQDHALYAIDHRAVDPVTGAIRWIRSAGKATYAPDGTPVRFDGINYDISARKQAEEAARQLAHFPEENPSPVLRVMPNGTLVYANVPARALLATLGWHTEAALPAPVRALVDDACRHAHDVQAEIPGRHDTVFLFTAVRPPGEEYVNLYGLNITERRRAQAQMAAALHEKNVLLQELYHRTKNNMHLIVAMLNLQAQRLTDAHAVKALKQTQSRILSMALVHEKLYQSKSLSQIDLKDYLRDLLQLLSDSYRTGKHAFTITTDMDSVMLTIDAAIPCGLIANELVSNAMKYAFPDDHTGTIRVSLRMRDDVAIELLIADDGIGLPAGMDYRTCDSLGLRSVIALAEHQLAGRLEHIAGNGTAFRVVFHAPAPKATL